DNQRSGGDFASRYSAGIGVAGAVGALAACEGTDGPLSGRSSIAIRKAMPNESTSAQARNTKRNAYASSGAEAVRANISTDMPGTPPRPPSTIAPSTATTSAENSERKKLAAPVATPICERDTAFCIQTVDTGNTVPSPAPMTSSNSSTSTVGIEDGQIASGASDRIESESPINETRL